jgi:hypothetical protein
VGISARGGVISARSGVDVNKPRTRATLNAVLALAPAASGFTVKNLAGKVHTMTGHPGYTALQAAYDLRKLRGKHLIDKCGRSRHFHLPPPAARSIAGLLTLRERAIAPSWPARPLCTTIRGSSAVRPRTAS